MSINTEYYYSAFSVDNVIFGFDKGALKVLLIKRAGEPYKDFWALPGALVRPDEDLDEAAFRILEELTGVENVYLDQVHTFGEVNRHPKGRVITIAYYSLVNVEKIKTQAASFAQKVAWKEVKKIDKLAFDHLKIMKTCLQKLKINVKYQPIGFELLPEKFTLTELQQLYEAILQVDLDKRNFRKKIMSMNVLKSSNEMQKGVAHRPAKLYSFDTEKYKKHKEEGYIFEI